MTREDTVVHRFEESAMSLSRLRTGLSAGAMLIGASVLLAWWVGATWITTLGTGRLAMVPLTAVMVCLTAAALLLRDRGPADSWVGIVASGCGWLTLLMASATLVTYASGPTEGLPSLSFGSDRNRSAALPSIPAPTTGVSLLLIGIALVRLERRPAQAQAAAIAAGLIAFSALVAALFGAQHVYGLSLYTAMAVHTAVAVMLLAGGVLSLSPACGVMAYLTRSDAAGTLVRHLLPVAFLAPFVFGAGRLWAENQGWFDTATGVALMVLGTALLTATTIVITAHTVRRMDHDLALERDSRRVAQHALREKDEYLAMVSHELRNPLNTILGYTRMLRDGSIPAGGEARALAVIERNAEAQAALVADLLDVSRLATGQLSLRPEPTDIRTIVEDTIVAVQPQAAAKQVRLETRLESVTATVDPDRARQIVSNLVTNAIKFTPSGGSVTVEAARRSDHLELTVEDTGIGISPAFLPDIFEPFRQESPEHSRQFGGLGLGLAIVRELVALHGGTVSAHSEGHNAGARFTIRLPQEGPSPMAVSIYSERATPSGVQRDTRKGVGSSLLGGPFVEIWTEM
jgi:signal transduction histidine kinase